MDRRKFIKSLSAVPVLGMLLNSKLSLAAAGESSAIVMETPTKSPESTVISPNDQKYFDTGLDFMNEVIGPFESGKLYVMFDDIGYFKNFFREILNANSQQDILLSEYRNDASGKNYFGYKNANNFYLEFGNTEKTAKFLRYQFCIIIKLSIKPNIIIHSSFLN